MQAARIWIAMLANALESERGGEISTDLFLHYENKENVLRFPMLNELATIAVLSIIVEKYWKNSTFLLCHSITKATRW